MLTEREKMQRAKLYMLKLAQGINPIDDSKIQDDAIKNERLSRCFQYIAQVLDTNINNDVPVRHNTSKGTKKSFDITEEQIKKVNLVAGEAAISELTAEINKTVDDLNMKKIQPKIINDWLMEKGYLKNREDLKGHIKRELTDKSKQIGITSKQGMGAFGEYTIILYSEKAQKFILDNLKEIIKFQNSK